MNSQISDFKWKKDENRFSWNYGETRIEKVYNNVPCSIVVLTDKSAFALVLSYKDYGDRNAFIINADGTERFRLDIPQEIKNAICFHEIYYIYDELTAIIATQQYDIACVIDIDTGKYKKIYETR